MTKTLVDVDAVELKDPYPQFISLVPKGANRIPFRITKSEEKSIMLNIDSRLWVKKEASTEDISVVAFVIPAESNVEAYTKAVESNGYKVCKSEVKEDSVALITKDDFDPEDVTTFKISDNVGVVVESVKKWFSPYTTSDTKFSEAIKARGFFPGFGIAKDLLTDLIWDIMDEAPKGKPPVEELSNLLDEFSAYVKDLLVKVPVTAFKMEDSAKAEIKKQEQVDTKVSEPKDSETVVKEDSTGTDETPEQEAVVKSDCPEDKESQEKVQKTAESEVTDKEVVAKSSDADTQPQGEGASADQVQKAEVMTFDAEAFSKSMQSVMKEAIETSLTSVVTKLDDVSSTVKKYTEEVDTLKEVVTSTQEAVKKTEEAIEGTVSCSVSDDRYPKDSDMDESSGTFDTAFSFPGVEG